MSTLHCAESCSEVGKGEVPGESWGWGRNLDSKRQLFLTRLKKGTMNVVPLAQMKEVKGINSAVHAKVLKFGPLDLVGILIMRLLDPTFVSLVLAGHVIQLYPLHSHCPNYRHNYSRVVPVWPRRLFFFASCGPLFSVQYEIMIVGTLYDLTWLLNYGGSPTMA